MALESGSALAGSVEFAGETLGSIGAIQLTSKYTIAEVLGGGLILGAAALAVFWAGKKIIKGVTG